MPSRQVTIKEVEELLNIYELEEILNDQEVSVSEALLFLFNEGLLELPEIRPVTLWDDTPQTDENDEF